MIAKPVPSATDCGMSEVCTVMLYLAMVPACVRSVISVENIKKGMLPERFELSISRLLSERLGQLGHGSSTSRSA